MKLTGFRIKKPRERIIRKMLESVEIPVEIMSGSTKIELVGDHEITVENCKGIIDYDDSYIKLSAGRYPVTVYGKGLLLTNLSEHLLMIKGLINQIELH